MAGETTVAEFNKAFVRARSRVRAGEVPLAEEQAALRQLAPGLPTEEDRLWADRLIEKLAQPATPAATPGPLYAEASAVQGAAFGAGGSTEEQIEAIIAARRKIFELASQAPADEAPHIRGLARVLEHLEEGLRNPPWQQDDPTTQST